MKTGQAGIKLIMQFEGCQLTAYRCPAGVPTIGYGHTAGVKMGQKITQAQADEYLRQDLSRYEKNVAKYDSRYQWNQNEFDAMVSFAYNLGSIDKLTVNGSRTSYYPKYTGKGTLLMALKACGCIDTSKPFRAKPAVKNGIVKSVETYKGTYGQNVKMLELLKKGKMKKI